MANSQSIDSVPNARQDSRFTNFNSGNAFRAFTIHAVLIGYSIIAMFPIVLTVMNSFKKQGDIFGKPYSIPLGSMFSTVGYATVFNGPKRCFTCGTA